jgi:hypothetical protein
MVNLETHFSPKGIKKPFERDDFDFFCKKKSKSSLSAPSFLGEKRYPKFPDSKIINAVLNALIIFMHQIVSKSL